MAEMTMRERMLAVVQGKEHDRVPFAQYDGLAAPNQEVWDLIGRGNMGVLRWCGLFKGETPNCRVESADAEINGRKGKRNTLHTPEGTLTEERIIQPTYGVAAPYRHYVIEPSHYKVLLAYLRDMKISPDPSFCAKPAACIAFYGRLLDEARGVPGVVDAAIEAGEQLRECVAEVA